MLHRRTRTRHPAGWRTCLMGMLAILLVLPATPVVAEVAPEGSFLPTAPFDSGSTSIPPPMLVDGTGAQTPVGYQTRLGWLLAAQEHRRSEDPLAARAQQPAVAAAIEREREAIEQLDADEASRYWGAMLNDLGTLEVADRDGRWSDEVMSAAAADLLAGMMLHMLSVDLGLDVRSLSPADARTAKLAQQARAQATSEAADVFQRLNLPKEVRDAWSEQGIDVLKLAEDYLERYGAGAVPAIFSIDDAGGVALGATGSTTAGLFAGALGPPDAAFGNYRRLAIDSMLIGKFGCADPLAGKFKAPQGWNIVLPDAAQTYSTSLGRILSGFGKTDIRSAIGFIDGRRRLLDAELKKIPALPEPQRLAYLAQFLHDLESLQAEYLADMKTITLQDILFGFATGAIATAFGIPATALATTTSLLTSAGFAALAADADLSEERRLMVSIAALRRSLVDQLLKADRIAGCVDDSIVLVADASGSMGDNDRIFATRDAIARTAVGMKGRTEVALIVFYDCDNIVVAQDFTTNPVLIVSAMDSVVPSGSTPLYDSIQFAIDYAKQNASSTKVRTPVLTDGEDTCR